MVKTSFGETLEEFRKRAGLSQEQFAARMRANGYNHKFGQRLYSHIIINQAARVYPWFFAHAAGVLKLNFEERGRLVDRWLELPGKQEER